MSRYVALLRAVNVGGHQQVAMSDLRALLHRLGFTGAQSLLQSGNIVFEGDERPGADLERLLEAETEANLGLRTDYIVRTAEELEIAIADNPFPDEASRDPSHFVVMFLKTALEIERVEALRAAIRGPEVVGAHGRQAYIVYPAGIGRSTLTGNFIEDKLGCRGTGRNWNTVLKLQALIQN